MSHRHRRPAVAVLSFVVALLVIGTIVLMTVQLTSVGAIGYLGHYDSTGAFYAAESGIEMALKELSDGNDNDTDGTIGSISDNGNAGDDPSTATGSFSVQSVAGTYSATGSRRGYERVIEVETQ